MLILTEEEKIVILLSMLIQFFRPPIILDHWKVAASALHPALTKHSNKLGNVFKKSTFLSYDARNMLTPGFDINAREKSSIQKNKGNASVTSRPYRK